MAKQDMSQWLADTFARNRALYGGFTMELDEGSGEGDETPTEETPAEETPAGDEGNEGGDGTGEEETPNEEVPADVLRANLTKANQEAARYRTRLREVEKALAERKTPEEVEEIRLSLIAERETAERSLLIENVALKHSLPSELAELLKGETREELEAHAIALAKFAPKEESNDVPPGDLNGGLNPGSGGGDDDGDALARVRKIKGYR